MQKKSIMRRKSERNKSSPSVKQPEKITRRTTRRNKKSPEKVINEEESENSSEQEESASSENEAGEVTKTPKRTRRTSMRRASEDTNEKVTRPKRKATLKQAEIAEEDCITADTSNDESALKTEVEPTSTSNANIAETSSKSEDESTTSNVNSTQQIEAAEKMDEDAPEENSKNTEGDETGSSTVKEAETQKEDAKPNTETNESEGTQDLKENNSNREVIPEETDQAVEIDSTTKSASSKHDKSVLIDLSAAEAASNNKTKKISENNADTTTDGERDGPATTTENREKENADSRTDEALNGTSDTTNRKKVNLRVNTNTKPSTVRKRKWLSNKNASANKTDVITISTDSLKGLISDVKPVPLSDVRLESSPEPDQDSDDVKIVTSTSYDYNRRSDEENVSSPPPSSQTDEQHTSMNLAATRKVSIIPEMADTRPPSPPKHNPSSILYITNLVRPFTLLQLKGLLLRTGKIVENGFWMDKIKSKCFVKYETEE